MEKRMSDSYRALEEGWTRGVRVVSFKSSEIIF